eukprot:g18960.t1
MARANFNKARFGVDTLVAVQNQEDGWICCRLKSFGPGSDECIVEDVDSPNTTFKTEWKHIRWLFGKAAKDMKSGLKVLALWQEADKTWTTTYYTGKIASRKSDGLVVKYDTGGAQLEFDIHGSEADVTVNEGREIYRLPKIIQHAQNVSWENEWKPASKGVYKSSQQPWISATGTAATSSSPSSSPMASPLVAAQSADPARARTSPAFSPSASASSSSPGALSAAAAAADSAAAPAKRRKLDSTSRGLGQGPAALQPAAVVPDKPAAPPIKRPIAVSFPKFAAAAPLPQTLLTAEDVKLPVQLSEAQAAASDSLPPNSFQSQLNCWHLWTQMKPLPSRKLVVAPYVAL